MKFAYDSKWVPILAAVFSLVMVGPLRLYPHFIFSEPYSNWLELLIGFIFWLAVFAGLRALVIATASRNKRAGELLKIIIIVFAAGLAAILVFWPNNVALKYHDRYGHSSESAEVTFVFTEPFSSLPDFENAAVIKKVSAPEGTAEAFLLPGKYGLYMEKHDGTKVLYERLIIDNARNDSPIGNQGPWYVNVGIEQTDFVFSVSYPQ